MKNVFLIFLILFTTAAYGQSDREQAQELTRKAIQEMEAGNTQQAIGMLEEAEDLDPGNLTYPYEIAFAHYLAKDYKKAIKLLKKLRKHPQVNDRVYQMLGNSYDMYGKPEKAIKAYDKGLERFPDSGPLHLERGIMEMQQKEYNKALTYHEKGIEVDPEFPSNYYWAAKLYLGSNEKLWGMIYGELFMNLERNSARTQEISKRLFDTYKSQVQFSSDTSFTVSFSKSHTITLDDLSDPENFKLPFGLVYEPLLSVALTPEKQIDLHSLNRVRSSFVDLYFEEGKAEEYPNVLFEYQKMLKDKGYLEAYNYWILMQGDQVAFTDWLNANSKNWETFIEWFGDHPIQINEANKFHSGLF